MYNGKTTILITGGAGYLGGALTDRLTSDFSCKEKHDVIVYDSLIFEDRYLKPGVKFVRGDIRDKKKFGSYLDEADIIVHLAAHVGDGACSIDPKASLDVNRESVKFVCSRINKSKPLIFISSCSVFGSQNGTLNENSPHNPLSLYAVSKSLSERIILDRSGNSVIFRLGTLFGLGDAYSRPRLDLVLNIMTYNAYKNKVVKVFGGEQWRPILHVRDAARAIHASISNCKYGVYNLAYKNVTILEMAKEVQKHFPGTKIETTNINTEDARNYFVDASKMENVLGVTPLFSMKDGILELKKMFEEERITDPTNKKYHNHAYFKEIKSSLSLGYNADYLEDEISKIKISSLC